MRQGYFSRSWSIFKTSWGVLKQDRELLWLAAMSFGVALVLLLLAGAVVLVAGLLTAAGTSVDGSADNSWWENPHAAVYVLLVLVVLPCLAIANAFFHGAIVHGALERLGGGDPTVQSALRGARSRLKQLALWGLFALTVSWLISILQAALERIRFVGWILSSLLELAWNVMKFLVIPIVVVEGLGPFASLRRSKEMLRETWGENLIGQFGMGIVGLLFALPGIILVVLVSMTGFAPVIIFGVAVAVIYMVGVGLFLSALNSVYQSVLYNYAVKGETPAGFSGNDVAKAFAPKRNRGGFGGGGGGFGGFGSTGSTTGF